VKITTVTEVQMRNMKCHWGSRELGEFIEIAIDATIVINERGIISHANLRAENLLEYPRAELIGHPIQKQIVPKNISAKIYSIQRRNPNGLSSDQVHSWTIVSSISLGGVLMIL